MMTDDQRTQAAAQRCADLANAEGGANWSTLDFSGAASGNNAFRRRLEYYDARDREVLERLKHGCTAAAIAKLRADLLPDPEPTLLEEFELATGRTGLTEREKWHVKDALDWFAKRGVEVTP